MSTTIINGFPVNNVPESAAGKKYIIVTIIDYSEYWYYGADDDRDKANEIALERKAYGLDMMVIRNV